MLLDRLEKSTVVCALIHYSLNTAVPDECIRVLSKMIPSAAWDEIIAEAREKMRTEGEAPR